MKKVSILVCLVLALFSSCDDYLDINDNPNQATVIKPALVLPQALTATALVLNQYNNYGMQIGGYAANAGGYGGFNETVSYAYTPANYSNLWSITYDNLEDYQYIINKTAGVPEDSYFSAVAKIMKAYDFQLLVDTYNDVPYSEALKGDEFLTPAYESGTAIYANLATLLDEAIADIKTGNGLTVKNEIGNNDVVFNGDMNSWMQFANTLKLKLLIRANGKVDFANTDFEEAVGFLTEDALINPGYTRDNNRQNPVWNNWAWTYNGTAANQAWIPSTFIMTFYDGNKIDDPGRGSAIYYKFPLTPETGTNQLGYESTGIPKSPAGSFWYPTDKDKRTGSSAGDVTGVLKGPDAGYPLFTAAESYFLQAEATVVGIAIPGGSDTETLFNAGITASFKYIYSLPDGSEQGDAEGDATAYIAANAGNELVDFAEMTTDAEKIRGIITQKYIALNMVNSHEGWNEYRRTGYPEVSGTGATTTFASKASQSTRPDRLPTRIVYPLSELQYNSANVKTVNPFTSTIFWAK
jgi:hypothetical protein